MLDIVFGKKTNPQAVDLLVQLLKDMPWEGTLYLGYPVFAGEDTSSVTDALLTTPIHGIVIFDLSSEQLFDLQRGEIDFAIRQRQKELARKLNSRLVAYEDLVDEGGLALAFKINVLTFVPQQIPEIDVQTLVTPTDLHSKLGQLPLFDSRYYKGINAAIQKTAALKPRKKRLNIRNPDSFGGTIKFLESQIANLDRWQKNAAIESPDGPQRIRGLAGSGKTIILALKAAYLHANDPDADIAVTFNTRSLYQQFKSLIRRFYFDQVSDEPNWEKLRIMHAWGSAREPGVYSTIAAIGGVVPMTFGAARYKYGYGNAFEGVCRDLVQHLRGRQFQPIFDYLLIDEAQDFPASFFQLAYVATKPPRRVVWAYDELQNLNDSTMPTLDQLFGVDEENTPLVDIQNFEGQPKQDILLPVCYRNPPWLLSFALGLGLGTKISNGKFVQMFRDPEFWREIGYECIEGTLELGRPVRLRRDPQRSPTFFEEVLKPADSITWHQFKDLSEQAEWITSDIKRVLQTQELDANDILVVIPDSLNAPTLGVQLAEAFKHHGIKSHLIGVTASRDVVFVENSIAMSGIFRAKGNEAPLVYVVSAEYCAGGGELGRKRNMLFTALTRAKSWVRVCGVGPSMNALITEMQGIAQDGFDLVFKYPTQLELEKLKSAYKERTTKDRRAVKQEIKSTEKLLQRILSGELDLSELPPGIAELLRTGIKR